MSVPEGQRGEGRFTVLVRKGRMTKKKVDECFKAWKAHAEKGNSKKLIRRMEEFYAALWKEDEHGRHEHGEKTENDQRPEKHGGHAGTDRKTAGDDRIRGRDGRRGAAGRDGSRRPEHDGRGGIEDGRNKSSRSGC